MIKVKRVFYYGREFMLYIFDMGNVIIDIDFNRVFAVWSKLSGVPLASIKDNFTTGKPLNYLNEAILRI